MNKRIVWSNDNSISQRYAGVDFDDDLIKSSINKIKNSLINNDIKNVVVYEKSVNSKGETTSQNVYSCGLEVLIPSNETSSSESIIVHGSEVYITKKVNNTMITKSVRQYKGSDITGFINDFKQIISSSAGIAEQAFIFNTATITADIMDLLGVSSSIYEGLDTENLDVIVNSYDPNDSLVTDLYKLGSILGVYHMELNMNDIPERAGDRLAQIVGSIPNKRALLDKLVSGYMHLRGDKVAYIYPSDEEQNPLIIENNSIISSSLIYTLTGVSEMYYAPMD